MGRRVSPVGRCSRASGAPLWAIQTACKGMFYSVCRTGDGQEENSPGLYYQMGMGDTPIIRNRRMASSEVACWRSEPGELNGVWALVERPLQDVLDLSGQYNASDAYRLIKAGDWQMWLCYHGTTLDSVVITTIKQFPRRRECIIIAATGVRMKDWIHHLEKVEAWALKMGCSKVRVFGRQGWERALKDYRRAHIVIEKDI